MQSFNFYRQADHSPLVGRDLSAKVQTANTIGQSQMPFTRRMSLFNRAYQPPLGVTDAEEGAYDAVLFDFDPHGPRSIENRLVTINRNLLFCWKVYLQILY